MKFLRKIEYSKMVAKQTQRNYFVTTLHAKIDLQNFVAISI